VVVRVVVRVRISVHTLLAKESSQPVFSELLQSYRRELRRLFQRIEDLRVSVECQTVLMCASRSISRRRLVERKNPSACATVDCMLCKREIALYRLYVDVITSECVTN
jgi:hypothetical protein